MHEFRLVGTDYVQISGNILDLKFEVLVPELIGDLQVALEFDFVDLLVPNFQSVDPDEVLCELVQEIPILFDRLGFARGIAYAWCFRSASTLFRFDPALLLGKIVL